MPQIFKKMADIWKTVYTLGKAKSLYMEAIEFL